MERLQKIIASAGIASRREAEKIILAGKVKVNGRVVNELGVKADADHDRIVVDGKPLTVETKSYYVFYKPRGVVTTMKDPEGRKCIKDFIGDLGERVYPVGRLDYNTEGLLLLTNDGELAQKLTHPSYEIRKTYRVKALGIIPLAKMDKLRMGVELEDGVTAPATVDLIGYDREKQMTEFNITIHEGRNRQVRRMCDAVGFPVRDLRRVKMGPLTLRGLGRGKLRELDADEIRLLKQL